MFVSWCLDYRLHVVWSSKEVTWLCPINKGKSKYPSLVHACMLAWMIKTQGKARNNAYSVCRLLFNLGQSKFYLKLLERFEGHMRKTLNTRGLNEV